MIDWRGMSLTDRAWLRLCPELLMIDDPGQLEAVLQRVRGKPSRAMERLRLIVTAGFLALLVILLARGPLNVTMWYLPGLAFLLLGYLPTFGGIMIVPFHRSRTRREVREHMAREAFPICIPCGHDLRGIPGPFCPECGSPTIYLVYAKPAAARQPDQTEGPDAPATPQ